jgi:hypothetical protein
VSGSYPPEPRGPGAIGSHDSPIRSWELYRRAVDARFGQLGLSDHSGVDVIRWTISELELDGQRACLRSRKSSVGDQCPQAARIVKQRVVAMAVGWAPNRLKAGPNGSGVNRLDTDDILAPHTPTKAPSNGSDCVLVCT